MKEGDGEGRRETGKGGGRRGRRRETGMKEGDGEGGGRKEEEHVIELVDVFTARSFDVFIWLVHARESISVWL